MFDILLQVDTAKIATELLSQKSENVWGVLAKGGMLMIPLLSLLVVAIFFFY